MIKRKENEKKKKNGTVEEEKRKSHNPASFSLFTAVASFMALS